MTSNPSLYDSVSEDTSYLSDEQVAFLQANEKMFWDGIVHPNPTVSNGDDLIIIHTSFPEIKSLLGWHNDRNIHSDIVITVVTPTRCGKSTLMVNCSQRKQSDVNKVTHNQPYIMLSTDTEKATIDMVVSIMSSRWLYVHNKNKKVAESLLQQYIGTDTPNTVYHSAPEQQVL